MRRIQEWLAGVAATLGPWGIFLVALGDSAFVPLPQGVDALLIAQAIAAPSTAYLAAGLAVIGSLAGSLILYGIARRGGRLMLQKKASSKGIAAMQRQIEKYDALVLLLPTMIPLPLPMKLFVIAAGVFQMKLTRFIAVIVFARCVRYFGEAFVALRYGEETTAFLKENTLLAAGVALALILLFYLVHRWSTRSVNAG
jgi:membrane protein YqaA with SNARE-associated domain